MDSGNCGGKLRWVFRTALHVRLVERDCEVSTMKICAGTRPRGPVRRCSGPTFTEDLDPIQGGEVTPLFIESGSP